MSDVTTVMPKNQCFSGFFLSERRSDYAAIWEFSDFPEKMFEIGVDELGSLGRTKVSKNTFYSKGLSCLTTSCKH